MFTGFPKTPRVGLEPTTTRLTAECSTIELSRIIQFFPQFLRCADTPFALPLSYRGLLSTFKTPHPNPSIRLPLLFRSCPRPISSSQLHALLHFHPCPIHLVVFKGSYFLLGMGYLILRGASRLDAFSVYPFRTWLPCRAAGTTTGTPVVRPARSSRTKASSSQISSARAG